MKKIILFTILTIFGLSGYLQASNPVTKVSFYSVYNYLPEVSQVEEHGMIDGRVMMLLNDENTPIDQKAAVINTLVFNNKLKNNASTFKQFMARKYRDDFKTMDINKLDGQELFCLGYITLLDDDGNPGNAIGILQKAQNKMPNSLTVNLILALTEAQQMINKGDKCGAWKKFSAIMNSQSLNGDMDQAILDIIKGEMDPYSKGCE